MRQKSPLVTPTLEWCRRLDDSGGVLGQEPAPLIEGPV
jgi:hypothetical protein